jgi:hypothetical protein
MLRSQPSSNNGEDNKSATEREEELLKRIAQRVWELWREELRLDAERRGARFGK